nr:ATP-binding protein [Sphingomonas colocasiae]
MFELLVDNILQNALKFADSGSTVSISLRHDNSDVLLEVANRGPEVPADLRDQIFERGVTKGGHGLGLYVVRMVARRHGGDAWSTEEPSGFRLIVRLPRAEACVSGVESVI